MHNTIKFMQKDKSIILWLSSGFFLIFIMVIVGGITRLTDSGLSMVNWSLFMGSVPPLNAAEWNETFELYKQSPEFKKINFNYTLEDFKFIFLGIFTPNDRPLTRPCIYFSLFVFFN